MLLLDEVKELRADERSIGAEKLTVARGALLQEIARAGRPERARRRLGLGLGIGLGGVGLAAAATVAVTAIVAGSVVVPVAVPEAAASEVFLQASEAVLSEIGAADAQLQPGQYLRIETVMEQVTTDGSSSLQPAESGAFRTRSTSVLYVPADRTQEWIEEIRDQEVIGVYGPGGQDFLDRVMAEPNSEAASVRAYRGGVKTYGDVEQPFDMYRDDYDAMPRDPEALLEWFAQRSPGGYAGLAILNALYQNLPPADVRAALLGALARVPGFTLVAKDGDVATIERSSEESTQQYVIDTSTGNILSFIDPQRFETDIVPEGMPDQITTFSMTVVDSAPEPTE